MNKNETLLKLLPKTHIPDHEKDEAPAGISRSAFVYNAGIAVVTALLLAFLLLPRFPLLEKGETATSDVVAPYSMYMEFPGPDQTVLWHKVNKGEVIVEAGHRVTDRTAQILKEISRREGIGNRGFAYLGLALLILLVLYLFYRDIKRYRAALVADSKKIILLSFLLLITVILSQFVKHVLSLISDKLPLDTITIAFALPVAAGAMLVCLLFVCHQHPARSPVPGRAVHAVLLLSRQHCSRLERDTLQKKNSVAPCRRSDRYRQQPLDCRHRLVQG